MPDGRPSERGIVEVADDVGNVIKGVNRLRLGPGMTMTHNPADPSIAIDATGGIISTLLSLINVDTVAALRATSALVMTVAKVAETSGYASVGDGGGWVYDWLPSNTDADDGALTIKVTALATGRWKFRMPDDRLFPLAACSIDKTGAIHAGAALTALCASLYSAGYYGIRGSSSTVINVTASPYSAPLRTESYPWKNVGISFCGDSPATNFTSGVDNRLKVESGHSGSGSVDPGPIIYGDRTCTQTVYAGDNTFNSVTDIRNLSVGDSVLVRLGADPTDAYGTAYCHYFAKILTITPTTGNAGNIVLDRRVPETPLNPLPAYNINFNRLANKHDLFKITSFQDNVIFEDCKFNDVIVGGQFCRNMIINRPTSDSVAQAFQFFGCEGTSIQYPYYKKVQGLNTDAGDPATDPYANYGGWLILNCCRDTVVHDLKIDKFSASGGICDEELNCRNTHFTGKTRVNYDTAPVPAVLQINNSFISTPHSPPSILIDDFASEGGGLIPAAVNARFACLRLGTQNARSTSYYLPYQQQFPISAGQVLDVLYFRNKEYRHKKRCQVLCSGIPVNGTKTFPIPVNGIVRICRFYASAVTGITNLRITGPDGTSPGLDASASIVAGQWVDFSEATLMSDGVQNFVSDVQWVSVTTDGTFNANTYISVDLEIWQPGVLLNGTGTITDASKLHKYSTPGAPSADADFIGQEVLGGSDWYKAKSIGSGVSDWVKISGAGDMLKSDNLSGLANYTTARSNLGLGTAATQNTGAFDAAGSAAAAQAASQPLDSDLTAIAALSTTSFGRALLTLADGLALVGQLQNSGNSAGRLAAEVLIDQNFPASVSSYTTPSFAGASFSKIVIDATLIPSTSGEIRLRINGDTGNNYQDQAWESDGSTISIVKNNGGVNAYARVLANAGGAATFKLELYPGAGINREMNVKGTSGNDADWANNKTFTSWLIWRNSVDDVSTITLLASAGTFSGRIIVTGVKG